MTYTHRYWNDQEIQLPVGKVVCVGRNYSEHAQELNNPLPATPILFIKPSTALVHLETPWPIPKGRGRCHHELELAVLVGQALSQTQSSIDTIKKAVVGYGLALDLTLRDCQESLKKQGHPWEIAKAFDGSCPMSPFLSPDMLEDQDHLEFHLVVNGTVRQCGNTEHMIVDPWDLIAYICQHFTLLPGDIVLTGTPSGVGELNSGDRLTLCLAKKYHFLAQVV